MKILTKSKVGNYSKISIFSLPIYEKDVIDGHIISKILFGFLRKNKCIKTQIKKIYLLGVKIYTTPLKDQYLFEIKKELGRIKKDLKYIKVKHNMELTIAKHHQQVFSQFKNLHKNDPVVIIAPGATMSYYKSIEGMVEIGVNSTCLRKDLNLSYWFAIDYFATKNLLDTLKEKKYIKFFGQCSSSMTDHKYYKEKDAETAYYCFPDSIVDEIPNSYRYYIDHPSLEINRDIEMQAMPDLSSCVFSAIRFALHTGTKKIYLVGCDASLNGYFDKNIKQIDNWSTYNILRGWNIVKEFVDTFYPDVEIISINPIGLKGVFKDFYTEDYLKEIESTTLSENKIC